MKEDENRIDSWLSQPYFCLMSNFGSYVKALRKASTHLTEEPYLYYQHSLICIITITLLYYENSLIFIIITFLFMLLSHLYLSVTPRTCSSVTLSSFTRNLLTRLLVNLSTRHVTPRTCSSVTLSSVTRNLLTSLLVNLSTCHVTPQTCSSVTLSSNTRNLLTRQLVNLSTCHVTLSPITSNLFTSLLVNLLTYIVTLSLVNLVTKKTEERQLYRYLRITIVSRRWFFSIFT